MDNGTVILDRETRKRTAACCHLLFNFFPQLMFDIFKVLKQNLGCGCERTLSYQVANRRVPSAGNAYMSELVRRSRKLLNEQFAVVNFHSTFFPSLCSTFSRY